jgi:hypothetical protein
LLVTSDLALWTIKDNKEDGLEFWPESALGHFVVEQFSHPFSGTAIIPANTRGMVRFFNRHQLSKRQTH